MRSVGVIQHIVITLACQSLSKDHHIFLIVVCEGITTGVNKQNLLNVVCEGLRTIGKVQRVHEYSDISGLDS